jgi:hypothetical protein
VSLELKVQAPFQCCVFDGSGVHTQINGSNLGARTKRTHTHNQLNDDERQSKLGCPHPRARHKLCPSPLYTLDDKLTRMRVQIPPGPLQTLSGSLPPWNQRHMKDTKVYWQLDDEIRLPASKLDMPKEKEKGCRDYAPCSWARMT